MKKFLTLFAFILVYFATNADAARKHAVVKLPGTELVGEYGCTMSRMFSDDEDQKFRLYLTGQEFLYQAKFFDNRGEAIKAEGLHGTGVIEALKLSFHNEFDNYSGTMQLVAAKGYKSLNGYWLSVMSEAKRFGTIKCERLA